MSEMNLQSKLLLSLSNSIDESKLKSLEARMAGPSKDGLPPIPTATENMDLETLKSRKFLFCNFPAI